MVEKNSPEIRIFSLTFSWNIKDKILFNNFSAVFEPGKTVSLIGPNGSGKTTLLELILGWRKPFSGKILIDNNPIDRIPASERGKIMALVPQEERLRFSYDVLNFVLLGRSPYLKPLSMPSGTDIDFAKKILEKLEIQHLSARKVTALSGGEKRLVLIARALVQDPDILLLDEPLNHLDPYNREKILQILLSLKKEGISLILSSHDPDMVLRIADTTVLLRSGREPVSGKTEYLINSDSLSELYGLRVRIAEIEERKVIIWGN